MNAKIPMSNQTYDRLKIIALIALPLLSLLVVGLSEIWGWSLGSKIDATIQLLISAINFLLGAALIKSSADYKKRGKK